MSLIGKWAFDGEVTSQENVPQDLQKVVLKSSMFSDVEFTPELQLQISFFSTPVNTTSSKYEESIILSLIWDGQIVKCESHPLATCSVAQRDESSPLGFSFVQNCDKDFHRFSILRLGPTLDESG